MSAPIMAIGAIASLVLPLCAGVVALSRVRRDFYLSTTRILGSMFIVTACGMGVVGAMEALLRGEQPIWPYLVLTGLPTLAVARILHSQGISLIER
jgi:hypothetical protein